MPIRHAAITACQRSPRTKRRLRIQPGAGSRAESTVRAVLEQQASCVLELPGGLQEAANELHALVVTAPDAMRTQLRRLKVPQLVTTAAAFRQSAELTTPTAATKLAVKSIAMRYQHLSAEIDALDKHLEQRSSRHPRAC